MKHYSLTPILLTAAAAMIATACHDAVHTATDATPLTLRATMGSAAGSRAVANDSWDGGELIALAIGDAVKCYEADANGLLTPIDEANTYWWLSSRDAEKSVSAWHTGNGYVATCPTTYTTDADQSTGLTPSDFIYAPAQGITYASQAISFYHQLTRVDIRVRATEGEIQEIRLGTTEEPFIISATYTPPTTDGAVFGAWDTTDGATAVITPYHIHSTSYNASEVFAQAVVIPQDRHGRPFVTVTLKDGRSYTYTDEEQTSCTTFLPGLRYAYTLSISNGIIENVTVKDWEYLPFGTNAIVTFWDEMENRRGTFGIADLWEYTENQRGTFAQAIQWILTQATSGTLADALSWLVTFDRWSATATERPWELITEEQP